MKNIISAANLVGANAFCANSAKAIPMNYELFVRMADTRGTVVVNQHGAAEELHVVEIQHMSKKHATSSMLRCSILVKNIQLIR